MATVSCCFTTFTCDLQDCIFYDLLNSFLSFNFSALIFLYIKRDYQCENHPILTPALSKKSLDSLPTFNFGFCQM